MQPSNVEFMTGYVFKNDVKGERTQLTLICLGHVQERSRRRGRHRRDHAMQTKCLRIELKVFTTSQLLGHV